MAGNSTQPARTLKRGRGEEDEERIAIGEGDANGNGTIVANISELANSM